MTEQAIEIRGLVKYFGHFTLGPIDLNVPKGAIYGLIGPNGAGTTTTIDLIMNMGREDAGTIHVFGMDHRNKEEQVKSRIGYVSPDLAFDAWGKVNRLVYFVKKFYPDWDDDYCRSLMEKMGLTWEDKIKTMSFGTRVKLNLVIALSHRPDLLLLDEPTMGVDAVAKKDIFTELLSAVQEEDRSVVITSHILTDIERFCDHFGIIHQGKILMEGPTAELVERHRMVDFIYSNGDALSKEKGIYIQEKQNDQFRALVDMQSEGMNWLKDKGASEISASPVTLEELFIALVQEKNHG
jgi:ABC-2 type transport system ATP-binding protein